MALKAFTMPKWGIEMQEGTIGEWLVAEGASFEKGDLLALVETDKITNEVEADYPAVLSKIVAAEGETHPVGALLAVFSDEGESAEEVDAFLANFVAPDTAMAAGKQSAEKEVAEPVSKAVETKNTATDLDKFNMSPAAKERALELDVDVSSIVGTGRNGRVTKQDVEQASAPTSASIGGAPVDISVTTEDVEGFYASPLAKRLAVIHTVDLSKVEGSGPRGRISKADVLAAAKPRSGFVADAPIDVTNIANVSTMAGVRKTIARRLTEAKSTIPHFYLRTDVDVDALLEIKKSAETILDTKISVNDLLVKAIALALTKNPDVNIQVHGDDIHHFPKADIAVAVATDKGVVTPVIRAANLRSMPDIASTTRDLATRARAGQLTRDELAPGTFTISNLGMFGVDQFDAIINPPQGAILAVGGKRRVFKETASGDGAFCNCVALSMSCDHRAIDGAVGATFLADLKELIEAPSALFKR